MKDCINASWYHPLTASALAAAGTMQPVNGFVLSWSGYLCFQEGWLLYLHFSSIETKYLACVFPSTCSGVVLSKGSQPPESCFYKLVLLLPPIRLQISHIYLCLYSNISLLYFFTQQQSGLRQISRETWLKYTCATQANMDCKADVALSRLKQ